MVSLVVWFNLVYSIFMSLFLRLVYILFCSGLVESSSSSVSYSILFYGFLTLNSGLLDSYYSILDLLLVSIQIIVLES